MKTIKKILDLHKLYLQNDPKGVKANLEGVNLEGANLEGVNLRGANLEGANLRGANLERTNLEGTILEGVNLEGANLRIANLRIANLWGANLRRANLRGANLEGANLRGAKNIPNTLIGLYKKDLLYVLMFYKNEVPYLKKCLLEGKINGSQYKGDCCCLIGTLTVANPKLCDQIPFYKKGLQNYSEQLFWQIYEKDKPKTNQFARIALKTIEYFENLNNYEPIQLNPTIRSPR